MVHLCFQGLVVVGTRVERSEERRGTRQIALGLCDRRFFREGIEVVRCDIENLIKLSQRFGEEPEYNVGLCVLGE